ncbi:MAG: Gfo/Idh/MocA family oxidoreductase [Acidobacteriota bacterium]
MRKERKNLGRREFLGYTGKLAAGALALNAAHQPAGAAPSAKMKLAMVGTGSRGSGTWGRRLLQTHSDYVEMVGFCDINPKRLAQAPAYCNVDAPTYVARDFDRMVRETKPDAVIITTPDSFHVPYAIRTLELGADVISEKPLATDAEQCQALLEAEIRTGKTVFTTFNARHGIAAEEIKRILLSGELGRIISAEFAEYLDVNHGASYFRRWHGKMRFSGSLLCHKASHHFDQMNWWLESEPEEVNAFGKVAFYGKNHSFRSTHCRKCSFTDQCRFYWDITKSPRMMELYVANEDADGYLRDGCVWDNDIDTYDSMSVEVKYANDVLLTYSLNTFMPYEGQRIAFNGEKGRLDMRRYQRQPWKVKGAADFRLTKSFEGTKTWTVASSRGEHGGSDVKLKDLLFKPGAEDPTGKLAGSRAGIMSSLIGIAARQSIETGRRVKIRDLVDFPATWTW